MRRKVNMRRMLLFLLPLMLLCSFACAEASLAMPVEQEQTVRQLAGDFLEVILPEEISFEPMVLNGQPVDSSYSATFKDAVTDAEIYMAVSISENGMDYEITVQPNPLPVSVEIPPDDLHLRCINSVYRLPLFKQLSALPEGTYIPIAEFAQITTNDRNHYLDDLTRAPLTSRIVIFGDGDWKYDNSIIDLTWMHIYDQTWGVRIQFLSNLPWLGK